MFAEAPARATSEQEWVARVAAAEDTAGHSPTPPATPGQPQGGHASPICQPDSRKRRRSARLTGSGLGRDRGGHGPNLPIGLDRRPTCSPSASRWVAGFTTNLHPSERRTVLADLKEIGPNLLLRAARRHLGRNILTSVMIRVDGHRPDQGRAAWCASSSEPWRAAWSGAASVHRPVALRDRLLYPLGRLLVYGPLRDNPRHEPHSGSHTPRGRAIGPSCSSFLPLPRRST